MRESDSTYFLYNGEGCVRVSPIYGWVATEEIPKWHYEYGKLPDTEKNLLDTNLQSKTRIFQIPLRGRYQIIARGGFLK